MRDLVELTTQLVGPDRIAHLETQSARPAQTAAWPPTINPEVQAAYHRIGITSLYQHQADAVAAITAGHTTVIGTGTGSGKSLPPWAAALSKLQEYREILDSGQAGSIAARLVRPTMLYLAPTKALAADQLNTVRGLIAAGALSASIATCDGDSSPSERRTAQSLADIIATNPDFLHFSLLPGHHRWTRLLRGLNIIVVDEAHSYRGIFGANVALVLRRLLRLATHYGARPTVVLLSATAADPHQLATVMLGPAAHAPVAITSDTSPVGAKRILLVRPATVAGAAGVADLLAAYLTESARTLAFVRSRFGVESLALQARERLAASDAERIRAYRGGYLPEERRALESALRDGSLTGLTATNALELGIDISGLDAVIISGWPGSRASLLQQAGRSGRAGRDGLAVFVAREDPLDTYLIDNPAEIFASPPESTVINVANPHVLAPQLCAAASELPLSKTDFQLFQLDSSFLSEMDSDNNAEPSTLPISPQNPPKILTELVARNLLIERPYSRWRWNPLLPTRASDLTDLRASGGREVAVVEANTGRLLGTVPAASADVTVHPGAIYLHQGQQFLVRNSDAQVAIVEPLAPQELRTVARSDTQVNIEQILARSGEFSAVKVLVEQQVTGFDRRRVTTDEVISSQTLQLPTRTLATVAWCWQLSTDQLADAGVPVAEVPGALHAAEHALISLLPLVALCDRGDIGGVSYACYGDALAPTIFVYDGTSGGAGFASAGYAQRARWTRLTADLLATCRCRTGCPRCIVSPKCGSGNEPLSKVGARTITELMAQQSTERPAPLR